MLRAALQRGSGRGRAGRPEGAPACGCPLRLPVVAVVPGGTAVSGSADLECDCANKAARRVLRASVPGCRMQEDTDFEANLQRTSNRWALITKQAVSSPNQARRTLRVRSPPLLLVRPPSFPVGLPAGATLL